jgi:hypothetical protein
MDYRHKPPRQGPFWTPIRGPFCEPVDTSGVIEIVLPDRIAVRISGEVDERTLRRVLAVLRTP